MHKSYYLIYQVFVISLLVSLVDSAAQGKGKAIFCQLI